MDRCTDIFIGSSSEGLSVAYKIKKHLSQTARCTLWCDGFFDLNSSAYDTLYKKLIAFDFSVFVGKKDDLLKTRKKSYHTVRDNIIFEFGIFSVVLGRKRSFLIFEKGSKLPSDLAGITLLQYANDDDIITGCNTICEAIRQESDLSRISMLPSTSNAISYYENFVFPVCASISKKADIHHGERIIKYDKAKLHILIPPVLCKDLKIYADEIYRESGYTEANIKGVHKTHSIYLLHTGCNIDIYDIPVILNSSNKAIELYMGKDFIGEHNDIALYKKREITNFYFTLSQLIKEDFMTNKYTKIYYYKERGDDNHDLTD